MSDPVNLLASIEKLEGASNYISWTTVLENYLRHAKLWECVEGYPLGDTTTINEKAARDNLARLYISLLVKSPCHQYIRGATSAKEMWDNLKKAFEDSSTLTSRLTLLRKFGQLKLDDFSNMAEYLLEFDRISDLLMETGIELHSEFVIAMMLAGLPDDDDDDYDEVLNSIEKNGHPVTKNMVREKLLKEELPLLTGKRRKQTVRKSCGGFRVKPGPPGRCG